MCEIYYKSMNKQKARRNGRMHQRFPHHGKPAKLNQLIYKQQQIQKYVLHVCSPGSTFTLCKVSLHFDVAPSSYFYYLCAS